MLVTLYLFTYSSIFSYSLNILFVKLKCVKLDLPLISPMSVRIDTSIKPSINGKSDIDLVDTGDRRM